MRPQISSYPLALWTSLQVRKKIEGNDDAILKNKTRAWNCGERVEWMGKACCQLHLLHVSEVGPLTFTTFSLDCCSKFCLQLCFHPPPCFLHQGQWRIVLPTSLGILIFAVWMFSSNLFSNNHQKKNLWSKDCLMFLGSNITTGLEMLLPWAWHCMLFLIWFQAVFQYTLPLYFPSHISCSHGQVFLTRAQLFPLTSALLFSLLRMSFLFLLCKSPPMPPYSQSLLQGVSQISGFHCPLLPNKEKKPSQDLHCIYREKWLMPSSREADGREGQRHNVSYWNPTARWRRSWA